MLKSNVQLRQVWAIERSSPSTPRGDDSYVTAVEDAMRIVLAIGAAMLSGLALGALTVQKLGAQTKPPVYFVVENEISDVQGYLKEYAPRAREMIKAKGGRYIAAGEA